MGRRRCRSGAWGRRPRCRHLHSHRGEHARERRGARRGRWESPTGSQVLDLGCGDGTTALPAARLGADVLGVDIASNLVEAGNARAREPRHHQLQVPGRRCVRSERARRRQLRPRRQHLRRDVRSQALRRGQGDGSCHAARRPDRDGQLDPQRPDARRPDPEDQLLLLAAASGRVRQPHDLGRRGQRDRAIRRRGSTRREHLVRAGHLHVQLRRPTSGASRPCSGRTTGRR